MNISLIQAQAFEMCRTGDFNLSHASLTSQAALTALRDLPVTNPTLYAEFTQAKARDLAQKLAKEDAEPDFSDKLNDLDDGFYDDGSDIPMADLIQHLISDPTDDTQPSNQLLHVTSVGDLQRRSVVEDAEVEAVDVPVEAVVEDPLARGRGMQKKMKTKPFGGSDWAWDVLD